MATASNDGHLDLFVANWQNENNFLFRNRGDGTFSRVLSGSPVNDGGHSYGCAWIDFNGDGALDLFVANRDQRNFLYRNNVTTNHWLRVRCGGVASNRAGVGAKVRLRATIAGKTVVQVRQIFAGDGENNGHTLHGEFGLGDAPIIEQVRVEWPSGLVQEFEQVAANQLLELTEPLKIGLAPWASDGPFGFAARTGNSRVVEVEWSRDLRQWFSVLIATNQDATFDFAEPVAKSEPGRFYRLLAR